MSEQFENSIRKKLEEADVPFDPAAWDEMKKRLDESDRRRPIFWWWTSGFLLLLLLSAGGWWYAQKDETTMLKNNVEANVEKTAAPQVLSAPNTSTDKIITENETTNVTAPAGNSNNVNTQHTIAGNKTIPAGNTNNGNTPNTIAGNKTNVHTSNIIAGNISSKPEKTVVNNSASQKESLVKQPSTNSTSSVINQSANIQTTDIPFNQLQKTTEPKTADTVNNSPVINKPVVQIPDTTANTYTNVDNPQDSTQTKSKKKKRGFEGGITQGPDYNIAPSFRMGKIGFNGGLLLRYHVNNRLNLSVGAIYSKKVYGALPKDYTFKYPVNYVKIDANCDVLDVPLNVNYTFLDKPKSTWSIMAGASSYFMLKEKYDYYWANNTKRTHEYTNDNKHYFSVLNLGVTWERKTAGRLKWGLQPYVKVPLGGVGDGKVKLSSAGVSLNLMLGKKD